MERPESQSVNHVLTVELSSQLYAALLEKVKITGKTETELVVQGLQQVLNETCAQKAEEEERFIALEAALEAKLKEYVETLIKERVSELGTQLPKNNLDSNLETSDRKSFERDLPLPTIRSLQVGDRVLILEPESPYYMAKLIVIKTSLIRATVETDTGEQTFLKRDLRFVEGKTSSPD